MRLSAVLAVFMLCASAFASFEFIGSMNGSGPTDSNDFFSFSQPSGLIFSDGRLYVADAGRNSLYIMNVSGGFFRQNAILSTGTNPTFSNPLRMAYDNGTLYVADGSSSKIKTYSGSGSNVDEWNPNTNMDRPSGIVLSGDYAYITDMGKGTVFAYSRATRTYSFVALPKGPSDGELSSPADIEFYAGRYYVSDTGKKMVYVYDSNFTFLDSIGRGRGGLTLVSPRGIQVYQGKLYVTDSGANRVVVFTLDGYPVEVLDKSIPEGNFSYPEDIAVAEGKIYVADSGNKLVKAFSINITSGNDSVAQAINLAQTSISRLHDLQSVADRLNVSYAGGTYEKDLQSAQSDYSNFMFASASVLAGKSKQSADSDYSALSQKIEVKIRQLSKSSSDAVAPYRQNATGNISALLSQFDNRIADVNIKLSAKTYSAAASSALLLPSLADGVVAAVQGRMAEAERKKQGMTAASFGLLIGDVSARFEKLKADAAAYRQPLNFSGAEALMDAARQAAASEDFESANYSLGLASLEIDASQSALSQASKEIGAGIANITLVESEFNLTASKGVLLPPDFSPERKLMLQAREGVYSNPQLAVNMAIQARDSALKKMREAQALSVAAAAFISIIGAIILVAAAFYIHLLRRSSRHRRRDGNHEEERKGDDGGN